MPDIDHIDLLAIDFIGRTRGMKGKVAGIDDIFMVAHYLTGAVDDRGAELCHRRVRQGLDDDFETDPVDISYCNAGAYISHVLIVDVMVLGLKIRLWGYRAKH